MVIRIKITNNPTFFQSGFIKTMMDCLIITSRTGWCASNCLLVIIRRYPKEINRRCGCLDWIIQLVGRTHAQSQVWFGLTTQWNASGMSEFAPMPGALLPGCMPVIRQVQRTSVRCPGKYGKSPGDQPALVIAPGCRCWIAARIDHSRRSDRGRLLLSCCSRASPDP